MSPALLLAIGGAGGLVAIGRFLIDRRVSARRGRAFPLGTLVVNLAGAFLLGTFAGLVVGTRAHDLLATGLVGGFTTFSTWALESHRLAEDGRERLAALNFIVAVLAGVLAARAGRYLGVGAVNEAGLKLTVYFGERDRVGGELMADALSELYARHRLRVSLVIRGIEGFGIKHHLRTDRLLTLSEDLPIVSVAVDTRQRIETVAREVVDLGFDGLVTVERARILTGGDSQVELPGDPAEAAKLTVYLGRHERLDERPAYETVVGLLRAAGIAGASVLLGVDGAVHGVRRRARFFARNSQVPLMIVSVGEVQALAEVLPQLSRRLADPVITLERVRVCKRDGQRSASPHVVAGTDREGPGVWQKLMVYSGEQSRCRDRPLHHELIRRLRLAGASGATTVRGIWGYHGDHEPHGDSFWQLRRRVPVVTIVVDAPARARAWFEILDEVTEDTGVVTSELVPAFYASGPGIERGGLTLTGLS